MTDAAYPAGQDSNEKESIMGKAFTSEVAEVVSEVDGIEYLYDFTLDDRTIHFRKPGDGEALLTVAATGRHVPRVQQLAAIVNLFTEVLDPNDRDFVIDKIYANQLGPKTLLGEKGDDGILADMLEQWSGRPTQE